MALPALTAREKRMYKDLMTVYVSVLGSNVTADSAGWQITLNNPDTTTLLQNIPCNFHATQNFDLPRSMGIQAKLVNEMTSNLLTCQAQVNIPADSRIHVQTRLGRTYWLKVQGAAQDEVLVPCTCVFVVPDKAPKTILAAA